MITVARRWGRQLRWPLAIALYLCVLTLAVSGTWILSAGSVTTDVTVMVPSGGYDDETGDEVGPLLPTTIRQTGACPAAFGVLETSHEAALRRRANQLPVGSPMHDTEAQRSATCDERARSHAVVGGTGVAVALVAGATSILLLRRRGRLIVVDPTRPEPPVPVGPAPVAPGRPAAPRAAVSPAGADVEDAPTPVLVCRLCGRPSLRQRSSFSSTLDGSSSLCRDCLSARSAHLTVLTIAGSLVVLAVGATGLLAGDADMAPVLFAAGLLAPLQCAQVAPHELGHAVVARAVGLRVPRMNIGVGTVVKWFDVGATRVAVRSVPSGGSVALLASSARGYRLRSWCAVAAGPAVQVVIIVVAWRWPTNPSTATDVLRTMLLLTAMLILVTNLFPREIHGLVGVSHTDGWHLAKIPFFSKAEIETKVAVDRVFAVLDRASRTRTRPTVPQDDLDGLERAAATGDVTARLLWCHALLYEDRYREAVDAARPMLAELSPASIAYVTVLNTMAWCLLMAGDVERGGAADTASAEAHHLQPSAPAVCGTRGSVLIELGDVDRGLALVLASMAGDDDETNRALNLAYVAIARHALGEVEQARADAAEVERLDPTCPLLPRMRSRLA